MMNLIQTIKNWVWGLGNTWGIDSFLQSIGPWPTFGLAIVVGLIYIFIAFGIFSLLGKIENVWVKVILIILALAVFALFGYIYIDGSIAVIGRLGGLL